MSGISLVPSPGRERLRARLGGGLIAIAVAGCASSGGAEDPEALRARVDDVLAIAPSPGDPLPEGRGAILEELAPLPSEALLVVYEVEGPGELRGSLEVLARPGGYRRENWSIGVTVDDGQPRRLSGSTVQGPDGLWVEGEPTVTASPLGALADAYLALGEDDRRAVIEQLRTRRRALAEARAADRAPREERLGVSCHVARVSTIEMCLWEATGLPLRYDSDALRLQAINIDTRASLGEHAFDLPAAPSEPAALDAARALRELADGTLGELAPYLHPGLRLPVGVSRRADR